MLISSVGCDAIMTDPKDLIIEQIRQDALKKTGELSKELANAKSEDKEEILANMELHRDLAEMCGICLDD
jgi:hypothetical protein